MSAVATTFEVGNPVRHAAHGLGVIQKIFAEDRAFVKFIAPTADGDTEDVVLLEDLELFEDNPISSKPAASPKPNPALIGPMPKTPLKGKAPFLQGWQNCATTDPVQLSAWAQIPGVTGFGGVAKAEIGGYWALETDSTDVAKRYKAETGQSLPNDGLITKSRQGGHRWFKHTPESIAMGNISQSDVVGGDFSVRAHNEQCVMPGSLHPSGITYELANNAEPKEAPGKLIAWLIKQKIAATPQSTSSSEKTLVVRGGRNSHLCHRAGVLRRAGLEQEEIESVLLRENETDLAEPLDDKEVLVIARSVSRYEKGPLGATVTIGGAEPGASVNAPQTSAETTTEVAVKTKNIHIDYSEDVFYGLAGKIIKKLQPETESHPVGNLLELLATFGNIVGPTAHYMIEDTRHYTNINVVKVGKSSKSRKGTGKARIERIASQLDSHWFTSRNISGLGSGEAVIWDIRDPVMGPSKNKTTGEVTLVQIDPGVSDKRLYISEGEFSGVLAVAGRKDSILSTVIRNAWDHKALRNKVKGSPAVCMNPHVSISADITRDELLNLLSDSDRFNGFGNRFLWCFVDRQGLKPHGGEDIDWSKEIIQLYEAVEFTKKQSRIFMDRNAREMWNRIYEELSEDVDAGVVGAVTGRGEAQVIRMALIFAMLDLSDHIRVEHLKAARALWQYCEDSARIIFGGVLKTHRRILDFIKEGPKTIREIQDTLFAKNRKVSEIQVDLNTLSAIGRVYTKKDEAGMERYYSVGS